MSDKSGLCLWCGRFTESVADDGLADCDRPECIAKRDYTDSDMDMGVVPGSRLDTLVKRGFCTDQWERWHQGQCGTYAFALIRMDPSLRLGLIGELEDGFFSWQHAFAHDDEYAYDAGGRHPLPYRGAWGNYDHQELDHRPVDFDFPEEEAGPEGPGPNLAAAEAHAQRHAILVGRYCPTPTERTT